MHFEYYIQFVLWTIDDRTTTQKYTLNLMRWSETVFIVWRMLGKKNANIEPDTYSYGQLVAVLRKQSKYKIKRGPQRIWRRKGRKNKERKRDVKQQIEKDRKTMTFDSPALFWMCVKSSRQIRFALQAHRFNKITCLLPVVSRLWALQWSLSKEPQSSILSLSFSCFLVLPIDFCMLNTFWHYLSQAIQHMNTFTNENLEKKRGALYSFQLRQMAFA